MPKRLIVCSDGTWNDPSDHTNIAWLAEKFHIPRIHVKPAPDLSEEMIAIDGRSTAWDQP